MTKPTQRPRATRIAKRWYARYRLQDEDNWSECRVLDVSIGGVALEHEGNADIPEGRLVIELYPDGSGSAGGIELRGEVRHVTRIRKGRHRVGIEFVEVSGVERHVLTDLLDLQGE